MRLVLLAALIGGWIWARRTGRMAGFFARKPAHISARNTAIFGMVLTVLIYAVALFQDGNDAQLLQSMTAFAPVLAFFLVGFGLIVYTLRRQPSNAGLAGVELRHAPPARRVHRVCVAIGDRVPLGLVADAELRQQFRRELQASQAAAVNS
jgi:amino acid transporter